MPVKRNRGRMSGFLVNLTCLSIINEIPQVIINTAVTPTSNASLEYS